MLFVQQVRVLALATLRPALAFELQAWREHEKKGGLLFVSQDRRSWKIGSAAQRLGGHRRFGPGQRLQPEVSEELLRSSPLPDPRPSL